MLHIFHRNYLNVNGCENMSCCASDLLSSWSLRINSNENNPIVILKSYIVLELLVSNMFLQSLLMNNYWCINNITRGDLRHSVISHAAPVLSWDHITHSNLWWCMWYYTTSQIISCNIVQICIKFFHKKELRKHVRYKQWY